MNRIFISGDTHGTHDFKKLIQLCEKEKLDYEDYIVICGDCGVVWDKETLKESIEIFDRLKTNILFIDGNHENFDMLNKYPIDIWNGGKIHKISKYIFHLLRGQVFNILGKTFFALGGADSSDKEYREEHISWWEDERITFDDLKESYHNLEKVKYKVDYVITHTPSTKTLNDFIKILTQCGEAIPYYLTKKVIATPSSDILNEIEKKVKYKKWFCGHLHIDEKIGKVQILYNQIEK